MNQGKRKYPAIDILKLYSGTGLGFENDFIYDPKNATIDCTKLHQAATSHKKWNEWLTKCYKQNNINELVKVKYGLQAGMSDLVATGIKSQNIAEMFVRWCKSIDKTAAKIIKKLNPLPNDNPLGPDRSAKTLQVKRKRDLELQKFLERTAF